MNPLKRKTIWQEERGPDSEKNIMVIRTERTLVNSPKPPPPIQTCTIEIASPFEDDSGRASKRRRTFTVDKQLVLDIKDATLQFERTNLKLNPGDGLVQARYEGSSPFVVMYEVPTFSSLPERKIRYVVGDGADIRFILGDFNELENLVRNLELRVEW